MEKQCMKTTNLYIEAARRKKELHAAKVQILKRLERSPEGMVRVSKNRGKIQYYLRNSPSEKNGQYLKFNDKRINIYLQKKNDEESLKVINKELANITHFLEKSSNSIEKLQNVYSQKPIDVKNRVIPIDMNDEDFAARWLAIPYIKKEIKLENQIYKSEKGDFVRSKSELNIANSLYKAGIPYKYECPMTLKNGIVYYPDFTILDVNNRRIVIWEHRGMMDDREYAKNAVRKQKEYIKNGMVFGDSLIITEETAFDPLGTDEIKAIVEKLSWGKVIQYNS